MPRGAPRGGTQEWSEPAGTGGGRLCSDLRFLREELHPVCREGQPGAYP